MVVPSASGMETMIFVFRGQPFVRAAVILSSSADTRSLDFAYGATPFIVPPFDPTEIGVTTAMAYSPALTYNISLSSPTVASASAPDPVIANHVPYLPDLTSMSEAWLGRPFVRGVNFRKIDTKDLDYVYLGAPFVITSSTVNDTFQVAMASAVPPTLVQNVIFAPIAAMTASAIVPTITNHSVYNPETGNMSQAWLGRPFIRSTFTSQDIEKTKSLDYAFLGTPFALTSSFVPPAQVVNLPAPTVVTGSAISLQIISTVIPQNINIASSSVGSITLDPTLLVSTSTVVTASAIDPDLVASITPSDITVITSSAGGVSLLPTVLLSTPIVSASVFGINLIASIVPQDVTTVTASVGDLSLLYNLSLSAPVITASVGDVSLLSTTLLAPVSASSIAIDPNLAGNVTIQDATVVTGSAFAPTLQILSGQSVVLPTCTAYASASIPVLIHTVALQVATSTALAIAPRLAQIYISSPATATATTGSFIINPSVLVGIPDLGINAYDNVDRAQPFDPHMVAGDQVNRGEPAEILGPSTRALAASRGIALATAPDITTTLADFATITLGTAYATATAIDMTLEPQQVPIIVEPVERKVVVGQSGAKRAQRDKEQEIIVGARLIMVNEKRPSQKIEGFVRIASNVEKVHAVKLIEGFTTRVRKPWEDIKIKITRVA
jgi:hypothetical protein